MICFYRQKPQLSSLRARKNFQLVCARYGFDKIRAVFAPLDRHRGLFLEQMVLILIIINFVPISILEIRIVFAGI